ncbi:unnamed protein product, partial [Chrysoparadoxa australica]
VTLGYERRASFKALMFQGGLKPSVHCSAWTANEVKKLVPLSLLVSFITWPTLFGGWGVSSWLAVWLWYLLWFFSSIPSNFLLCRLISSSKYQIVVGVIWFVSLGSLTQVAPAGDDDRALK